MWTAAKRKKSKKRVDMVVSRIGLDWTGVAL